MSIGFWQIIIVLAIIIFGISKYLHNQQKILKKVRETFPLKIKNRKLEIEKRIKTNDRESSLGDGLKRLKKMYNDGHLSKVEFEKAKNKLLK
jgi:hypothetical protein|tara:strand:+ start:753 stop:1028 length:276 start_codon:yes stop_codon:yes gene_type:complete